MATNAATRIQVSLSRCTITPSAAEALQLAGIPVSTLLTRHLLGDWGLCEAEDAAANDAAIESGDRTLAVYGAGDDRVVWVIADAALSMSEVVELEGHVFQPSERYALTILLPEEY